MVHIKTDTDIEAMREAGRIVAQILTRTRKVAAVGVTPRQLDEAAREVLSEAGASSPFLNYRPHFASTPFPAVVCVSVNDAIVHGIPSAEPLRDGDLVSVDTGALLDGWAGDSAVSFTVGRARPADTRLIATADRALEAGIAAAVVGNRIGDIAHAIGTVCRDAGYGIMEGYGGHGIGRSMHEDPPVPNEGRPGRGMPLRHGMVLAIEPMLIAGGGDAFREDRDGWTLRTADGTRAAHSEHTVAVTDGGPRVLTAL
ncbi:type I methionyl aminopeptidase [Streptomyces sp. WZ.A104]|uniref:Methionine aminopeptidase n=1 Tax=Streptomyces durocortorensis TaxID=2811104 RepID=A0ABY9W5S0_9ACTN|nr:MULTISPECIES: type I methionyl aminopeptidase [Streptomyces]PCG86669.1 type I methionyl aminopeptidase [Streptomyces sp. WZ.A104]WNF30411.1 type I methionyl aminopeptidase [Streptomyces durocortorensis]